MKLLTICVPCYNSQDYMERCLKSLLVGGDRVEILIIDDGSKDNTAAIADQYERDYPGICRAVHKPNGGHGSGVNVGIELANGLYYKVVDSDDWLDTAVFLKVLDRLENFTKEEEQLDLFLCNYTYMKVGADRNKVIHYESALPVEKVFGWDQVGRFRKGSYILMHSVIYRTELLRECEMHLPEHCFYVDNIYVFRPLPYVKRMYYMNENLYCYYIGREDQSVNEKIMISRLDQQVRVTKIMIEYYTKPEIVEKMKMHKALQAYMYNYLEIIVTISSVLALLSNTKEHIAMKDEMWEYLKKRDGRLYQHMRHGVFGTFVGGHTKGARYISVECYRVVHHFFNFN
jgi:glycosyltransferase involved in cell wall biosynthesis